MRSLRAVSRLIALAALTLLAWLFKLLGAPLRVLAPRLHQRWRDRVFRVWASWVTRLIGMQAQVRGRLPEPPFLLVANHLGYVDIFLLARYLPAVFVAKHELASWPVAGRIIASVDTIFIDRSRKRALPDVSRRIAAALQAGNGVILFPEGTSTNGEAVLPLMPSLLAWAAEQRYPVWYAAISYETGPGEPPASDAVCWWGDTGFLPHLLAMLRLPHFVAHLDFARAPIIGDDRKQLALLLHEAISRLRAGHPGAST